MIEEIIRIIEQVKERITHDSDIVWTGYNSAEELRAELDMFTAQLKQGDLSSLQELHIHFLPTSALQEHSISNGWMDEYIRLAEKFDTLFASIKRNSC